MSTVCAPGTRPEPRRKVKHAVRAVRSTPVEYKSHNRWLLVVVYATWLWILWNVLVFAYLGVRDQTQVRDLFPDDFLQSLSQSAVLDGQAEPEPEQDTAALLRSLEIQPILLPARAGDTPYGESAPVDPDPAPDSNHDSIIEASAARGWFPADQESQPVR